MPDIYQLVDFLNREQSLKLGEDPEEEVDGADVDRLFDDLGGRVGADRGRKDDDPKHTDERSLFHRILLAGSRLSDRVITSRLRPVTTECSRRLTPRGAWGI